MTITFADASYGGTDSPLWFRVKGTSNKWTDWFSKDNLTDEGTTYNWYAGSYDIGVPTEVIVLNRANDGIWLREIGVNNVSYTFTASSRGILVKYSGGGPQYDGCGYAHVNFTTNDYDSDTYAGEDLGGETCPYLANYSFPTLEPTMPPTSLVIDFILFVIVFFFFFWNCYGDNFVFFCSCFDSKITK